MGLGWGRHLVIPRSGSQRKADEKVKQKRGREGRKDKHARS